MWVRLRLLSKGQPALHAMVCVPTTSDLQQLLQDACSSGPQEPGHREQLEPAGAVRGVCPAPAAPCSAPLQPADAGMGDARRLLSGCRLRRGAGLHQRVWTPAHDPAAAGGAARSGSAEKPLVPAVPLRSHQHRRVTRDLCSDLPDSVHESMC